MSRELRNLMRLSGREKRARVFIPVDRRNSLEALRAALRESFPLAGVPHILMASLLDEQKLLTDGEEKQQLELDGDLAAALAWADACDLPLHVYVEPDPSVLPPELPPYLRGLPPPGARVEAWQVLSFYRFVEMPDPEGFANALQATWRVLGARGRVYIAHEGINAQMAVPMQAMPNFAAAIDAVDRLRGTYLNCDTVWSGAEMEAAERRATAALGRSFPFSGLHVRVRHQVVADGLEVPLQWNARIGKGLSPRDDPAETAVDSAAAPPATPIVLDCRNDYESDVGIFDAALPLSTSFFRESWNVLRERLANTPRDTPLLTYCTGGIRCVKVAAFLEQEMGFRDVARLEGGIVSYARFVREAGVKSKFKGKNYVFDQRMGERITDDVLSGCDQCGDACDDHVNCANPRCHARFLQCPACSMRYEGCCSRGCQRAVALAAVDDGLAALAATAPNVARVVAATEAASAAADGTVPAAAVASATAAGTAGAVSPSAGQPASAAAVALAAPPVAAPAAPGFWLEPQPFQDTRLNRGFDDLLESYCEGASSPEPPLLTELRREAERLQPQAAHMVSSALQGRLLSALAALVRARRVLEIGTFMGYSALCFAEAVPAAADGGTVVTCEVDPAAAAAAQSFFDRDAEHGGKISMFVGPAAATLDALLADADAHGDVAAFDLIFVDGDKKNYGEYYRRVMERPGRLLRKGGLLVADNTLFRGMVIEAAAAAAAVAVPARAAEATATEATTAAGAVAADFEEAIAGTAGGDGGGSSDSGLRSAGAATATAALADKRAARLRQIAAALHEFNELVRADPRTEQVVLPIRDGLSIVRWKG
ncbi:unnamed protein product [Phaeothamnion confervicola]